MSNSLVGPELSASLRLSDLDSTVRTPPRAMDPLEAGRVPRRLDPLSQEHLAGAKKKRKKRRATPSVDSTVDNTVEESGEINYNSFASFRFTRCSNRFASFRFARCSS